MSQVSIFWDFALLGGNDLSGQLTGQYARLVQEWVASIGLDAAEFGTHSLRRTKAALIYRQAGNLRAVQLLLGHSKIENTVRHLGIEVDDAIEITEKIDNLMPDTLVPVPDMVGGMLRKVWP